MSESTIRPYTSDPDLIQACLDGDEPAWKVLVERYGRLVYSIPLRNGLSASEADDVFQNVFIIVHRRLESLRDKTLLASWLITITQRESARVQNHNNNHRHSPLDDEQVDDGEAPLDLVHRWEQQHLVQQAMARLEPRCRELLTALFFDSSPASYDKLAERLGVGVSSIGPTRARCFKKLQAILVSMGFMAD